MKSGRLPAYSIRDVTHENVQDGTQSVLMEKNALRNCKYVCFLELLLQGIEDK